MTNEEALETINTLPIVREEQGKEVKSSIAEALDVAVKALEKQIPKKPIIAVPIPNNKSIRCPNCNTEIFAIDENNVKWGHEQFFCEDCGQAIDWSEDVLQEQK